jgi:hypothetical protein
MPFIPVFYCLALSALCFCLVLHLHCSKIQKDFKMAFVHVDILLCGPQSDSVDHFVSSDCVVPHICAVETALYARGLSIIRSN